MKQTLLKQLTKLEKIFLMERYDINFITRGDKRLVITITLKEGDKLEDWVKHSA